MRIKKSIAIIAALLILLTSIIPAVAQNGNNPDSNGNGQLQFYVSPNGDDSNPGTYNLPFKTIEKARDVVREYTEDMKHDIIINLCEGTFRISQPLVLDERDSGKNGYKVVYKAFPSAQPVIDGGYKVNGTWEEYSDGIMKIQLPEISDMRELFVNNKRQTLSSSKLISGGGLKGGLPGFVMSVSDLPEGGIAKPQELVYVQNSNWRTYMLPIGEMLIDNDLAAFKFAKPYIDWYTKNFNFEADMSAWFRLENALEFIDEPGEWYFDKSTHYLYYMPEAGADLAAADVEIPVADSLLDVRGTNASTAAHDIQFEGLTFRHSTWMDVKTSGFCHVQSSAVVNDKGWENQVIPAAINVINASNIVFEQNTMEFIGESAVNLNSGVSDIELSGNILYDISGVGINVGLASQSRTPLDSPELPKNIHISNNILREIGVEFQGSPAIASYYTDNLSIEHNFIDGVNYSGISVGWGWNLYQNNIRNTFVGYNVIQNFSRKTVDGGGIYSLSNQPGSAYKGNYIKNVYAPFNTAALYHDQGSAGFTDEENVLEIERGDFSVYNLNACRNITIRNNYTTTANAVNYDWPAPHESVIVSDFHIVPDANWPAEAKQIIKNAGLTDKYKHLLSKAPEADREPRPYVRTSGTNYAQSLIWEPASTYTSQEVYNAPFLEESGRVIMEAIDYNGYKGLEQSDFSFIGVLGWFGGFSGKYTLMTKMTVVQDHPINSGVPELSYNIKFADPGEYYLLVRGKAGNGNAGLYFGFNGTELGKMMFPSGFTFVNTIDGEAVKVNVPAAGVYTLTIKGDEATKMVDTYLDRIVLTQELTEELYDGSTAYGPQDSAKDGVPNVLVPVKKQFAPYKFPSPTPADGQVNDDDGGIDYSSGWGNSENRWVGDYMNDVHYATKNGEYLEYTFKGTGVDYIAETNKDEGDVDIYIDGVFQQTVSCYTSSRQVQQAVFSIKNLPLGTHTIKAVKMSGSYMIVDKLQIFF